MSPDLRHDEALGRTPSQLSTASARSSVAARLRSRQHSIITPESAKTLESFPSLSPDASPATSKSTSKSASQIALKDEVRIVGEETPRKTVAVKTEASTVASLIHSSPLFCNGATALFADERATQPQGERMASLHLVGDDKLAQILQRQGPLQLVRQMSKDIADRDAKVAGVRRLAKAREEELRLMLRDVEVSNSEIEKRLIRVSQLVTNQNDHHRLRPHPSNFSSDSENMLSNSTHHVGRMLGEAMADDFGMVDVNDDYLDKFGNQDRDATLKGRGNHALDPDTRSTGSSIDSNDRTEPTPSRGWRNYLWSGNNASRKTSKASSVISDEELGYGAVVPPRSREASSTVRRRALDDHLFEPPAQNNGTTQTPKHNRSRKTSSSIASWTVKLFAGSTGGAANESGKAANVSEPNHAYTTTASRSGSMHSESAQSAKDALTKVNNLEQQPTPKPRRKSSKIFLSGQSENLKSSPVPPVPPLPTTATRTLGPVEMDTILPSHTKPPTLTAGNAVKPGDVLTDRFGFIYDRRRRRKEVLARNESAQYVSAKDGATGDVETIASTHASVHSAEFDTFSQHSGRDLPCRPSTPSSLATFDDNTPTKPWQDYLRYNLAPGELLSHTPALAPGSALQDIEASVKTYHALPVNGDIRASFSEARKKMEIGAGTAHDSKNDGDLIAGPTYPDPEDISIEKESEPIKMLLDTLTDVHDAMQRERTIQWNEFLRKVRAERARTTDVSSGHGSHAAPARMVDTPEASLLDGEVIGVAGLGNTGKVGRAKWKEFKHLVLGGIPVAYRAKIWAECSGAAMLRVPGYYDDLVARTGDEDSLVASQIEMDIHRTLTDNIFFRTGPGVSKLKEVLLAYSRRNPEIGYCQGMNMIAGSLLLAVPTAEDAFWIMTSIVETILPRHYYDQTLLTSRADQQVLRDYVAEILPRLSAHLDTLGIELDALTFQWFLSIFTDCLSAEALFRVWDVMLCFNDGSTFLFQVAVTLLKLNETQLLACDSAAQAYTYIGHDMTNHAIGIDGLIRASEALKNVIRRTDVEHRRQNAVEDAKRRDQFRVGPGSSNDVESRPTNLHDTRSNSMSASNGLSLKEPRPMAPS